MPSGRPEFRTSNPATAVDPAFVGRVATRAGLVLVAVAVPVALVTLLAILASAPSAGSALDTALSAATGPLAGVGGVEWLFHVGVLGVMVGAWILGLGQVLSGLFD